MKNNLPIVMAITVVIAASSLGMLVKHIKNDPPAVVEIDTEIDRESSKRIVNGIRDGFERGSHRVLVELNSPGGSVFDGKVGISEITNTPNVDTYISGMAASMAAQTFMAGTKRYMEPDALILFHGAHLGSQLLTQKGLEKLRDILVSKEFVDAVRDSVQKDKQKNSKEKNLIQELLKFVAGMESTALIGDPLDSPFADMLLAMVKREGYDIVLRELTNTLSMVTAVNESGLIIFDKIIEKSNGKWTRDKVRSDLYGNYEKDMIFTGEQMYKMGLIDGLGRPPLEDYDD